MAFGSLTTDRFLVTGAYGCIGVWVLRELLDHDASVIAVDVAADSPRLRLVVSDPADPRLVRVQADIADLPGIEQVIDKHEPTRIIHLAALQVPFCRADPPRGAAVNVVGTTNMLEATRRHRDRISHLVYASSIAAYDAYTPGQAPSMTGLPGTIYGVYKRANEQTAARYAADEGVQSIGLRPHTVFGPGRDQGLTSAPTMAMLAAAADAPYTIPYSGVAQFQYARDVARTFIRAALATPHGATVYNLAGAAVSISDLIGVIEQTTPQAAGRITQRGGPLAFPETVEAAGLRTALGDDDETPFPVAVAETIRHFTAALADGRITAAILDR
jgi:UDP-glucuronate 4-epimerase